jgi:hypothetical protein
LKDAVFFASKLTIFARILIHHSPTYQWREQMKKIFLILSLMLMYFPAHAQFVVKVGILGGLPMGSMTDFYNLTAGAEASIMYQLDPQLSVGVTSGFHHFFEKDWGYGEVSSNMVPIRACLNYYLSKENIKPYVGAEAGIHFTMLSYSYSYYVGPYYGYSTGWRDYSETRFGFVPLIGLEMGSGSFAFDMSARYTLIMDVDDASVRQDISFLAVKIGTVIRF